MAGTPERLVGLNTGQSERVLAVTIDGIERMMEVVAPCRFTERRVFNADQWLTHEGWAMPLTAETDAAWMICNHEYDANGNRTATKWASVAFNQKWSDYATLTYS